MPTSLAPVDIANLALSKIGAQAINSLTDQTSPSAVVCNTNLLLSYLETSRATRWNCLLTTAVLTQIPQTPLPPANTPPTATAWAPLTAYAANVYVTYGGYYYQVMWAYTSSANFTNDLTTGVLTQTTLPTTQPFFPGCGAGGGYASGWAYEYALPADFQLLDTLNGNTYWGYGCGGDSSDEYEIMGLSLYCDEQQAAIQYVQNQPDTSRFDSMLTNCVVLKLASMIATPLRQDGGALEQKLLIAYEHALKIARAKNGGEKLARRFNPIYSSRFNQARYGGANG